MSQDGPRSIADRVAVVERRGAATRRALAEQAVVAAAAAAAAVAAAATAKEAGAEVAEAEAVPVAAAWVAAGHQAASSDEHRVHLSQKQHWHRQAAVRSGSSGGSSSHPLPPGELRIKSPLAGARV